MTCALFVLTVVGTLANSYGIVVLSKKLRGDKPNLFNYEKLVKVFLPNANHYSSSRGHGVYANKGRNLLVYQHDSKTKAWEQAWHEALSQGLIKVPGMRPSK